MSDQFVQVGPGGTGTSSATDTLSGVAIGSTIIAFGFDGSASGSTITVSDAQGSYTQASPPGDVNDTGNVITSGIFFLQNANAGTHAVTVTGVAGHQLFVVAIEVQSLTSWTLGNAANGADQVSPGAGANVLSSGTMTFSVASTIVSLLNDNSSTNTSDEPTAGTSPIAFTSRASNANTVMGAWRVQTAAASSNAAATGGPVTTTDHFITLGIAVPNSGGASGPPATPMGRRYWVNP